MLHADSSKSQAIFNKSYILPCLTRYQRKVTVNKSYILPCLTQIPANHRQQIVHLAMPHTDTSKSQATNRASSCFPQVPLANHRQQIVHLTMPYTDTSKSGHRQQIVHLTMPHTDTSKSQATNRTSYHALHRYQQIIGNKSSI